MNRWTFPAVHAAMEHKRRQTARFGPRLPATMKLRVGFRWNRRNKETPLDLSIAKAQRAWRIFEVKFLQYILFRRSSVDAAHHEQISARRSPRDCRIRW